MSHVELFTQIKYKSANRECSRRKYLGCHVQENKSHFKTSSLQNSLKCIIYLYQKMQIYIKVLNYITKLSYFFVFGATALPPPPPQWAMASSFTGFLDHTQGCTTVGSAALNEWSSRRTDLYLTTHNTQNRRTSMPPVGFEPTISAGERPLGYKRSF